MLAGNDDGFGSGFGAIGAGPIVLENTIPYGRPGGAIVRRGRRCDRLHGWGDPSHAFQGVDLFVGPTQLQDIQPNYRSKRRRLPCGSSLI
jgi:hypothetical protein